MKDLSHNKHIVALCKNVRFKGELDYRMRDELHNHVYAHRIFAKHVVYSIVYATIRQMYHLSDRYFYRQFSDVDLTDLTENVMEVYGKKR